MSEDARVGLHLCLIDLGYVVYVVLRILGRQQLPFRSQSYAHQLTVVLGGVMPNLETALLYLSSQ